MSVYSKIASKKQKRVMAEYEQISGFEFMGQDDFDEGMITFGNLWFRNVKWLEDHYMETIAAIEHLHYPLRGR